MSTGYSFFGVLPSVRPLGVLVSRQLLKLNIDPRLLRLKPRWISQGFCDYSFFQFRKDAHKRLGVFGNSDPGADVWTRV